MRRAFCRICHISLILILSNQRHQVTAAGKVDKTYDSKVSKLISERDKHAEALEGQNYFSRDSKSSNEVQRFLTEGLDKVITKNLSRKAKLLVNKRQGRSASYGLVLEELLQSRGQSFEFPGSSPMEKKSPEKKSAPKSPGQATASNPHSGSVEDVPDVPRSPKVKVSTTNIEGHGGVPSASSTRTFTPNNSS